MENVSVTVKGKRQKIDSPIRLIMEGTALALMGVKQLSLAYTVNGSSSLQGYNKNFDFMELPDNPGLAYVFGMQDTTFAQQMIAHGNVTQNTKIASVYAMANTTRHDFKATYQPIKDLRIDFSGQRSVTENRTQRYFDKIEPETRQIQGAYTVNIWSVKTAFTDHPTKKNVSSKSFDQYRYNLHKISWQLADQRRGKAPAWYNNGNNYDPEYNQDTLAPGYTPSNPDIAIPAFLAAYTGSTTNKKAYNFMNWMFFRPGWRLKYDGLINYEFVSKYFKNLTLSHGYNSTFTVGSFQNNLFYMPDAENLSWTTSKTNSKIFVPQRDIASFAITEQFSPLFGIDMTWRSNIITKFEYKKSRTMTMSLLIMNARIK
jgi:cell surface protein SprA